MRRVIVPDDNPAETVSVNCVGRDTTAVVRSKGGNTVMGIIRYGIDATKWHVAIGQDGVFKGGHSSLTSLVQDLTASGFEVFVD